MRVDQYWYWLLLGYVQHGYHGAAGVQGEHGSVHICEEQMINHVD